VQTDPGGEVTTRFVISASGVLTVPKLPDIDGVDCFDGVTMHTARWDHSKDLTAKRVAIIGTGASAVQIIPEIAPIVSHLTVFQRTPIWCFPKLDVPLPALARWAMRIPGGKAVQRLLSQTFVEATFPIAAHYFTVFPLAKRMESAGKRHSRQQVKDPVMRDQLTPRYAVGCKRPGFITAIVHVQPRQCAAGHRADRQGHAHGGGHRHGAATRSMC
jgi:cation diffusion facilitator CzcD-associated flavoprotein CzcO